MDEGNDTAPHACMPARTWWHGLGGSSIVDHLRIRLSLRDISHGVQV
jgi:hypothetical protein